jgi:hypothetical protein
MRKKIESQVGEQVYHNSKLRIISVVNTDKTIRLKSNDPTEKYYSDVDKSIGCFTLLFDDEKQIKYINV